MINKRTEIEKIKIDKSFFEVPIRFSLNEIITPIKKTKIKKRKEKNND